MSDKSNGRILETLGLVSGAVWSDLNGDGLPELVAACEWGSIKIFRNNRGQLASWDPPVRSRLTSHPSPLTLSQLTGWWTGVTAGDLDGDGRLDLVAANWGLNGDYAASQERPQQLYYGDWLERSVVELLEAEWEGGRFAPRRRLDVLGREWPALLERFRTHRAFSEASVEETLGPWRTRVRTLAATTLASMIFLNRGDHFEAVPLPSEAQWAPAFAVNVADFDGDGHEDVSLSQNFFATAPETPRLDAGRGLLLRGDGTGGLRAVPGLESGIEVYGEQRGAAVADYDGDGRADLVVAQNGAATRLWRNVGAKPGLRVRLVGDAGNPYGVGAVMRLKYGSRFGPARELHAGSGYWSQDGTVQVLGRVAVPTQLWVRWPGGETLTLELAPELQEVTVKKPAARAP